MKWRARHALGGLGRFDWVAYVIGLGVGAWGCEEPIDLPNDSDGAAVDSSPCPAGQSLSYTCSGGGCVGSCVDSSD
jgi:hypothetical protein